MLAFHHHLVAWLERCLTEPARLRHSLTVQTHLTATVEMDILMLEYPIADVWFQELEYQPCQKGNGQQNQYTLNHKAKLRHVVDDHRVINRSQGEFCHTLGNQVAGILVVETYLQLMNTTAEHLTIRMFQGNPEVGEVNMEVLQDIILNLQPIELRLPDTIQLLAHEADDIGIHGAL